MLKVVKRVRYNHLPKVTKDLEAGAQRIIWATALTIERDAKKSLEGPKHGRVYKRKAITRSASGRIGKGLIAAGATARIGFKKVDPGTKGARVTVGYQYHRASAPGEAPAVDSGLLRSSIQALRGNMLALVIAYTAYAGRLEMKMRRAFLGPAADKAKPSFVRQMTELLRGLR